MDKAASVFLRTDLQPADVRHIAGWLQDRQVTRYLNEGRNTAGELDRLLRETPPPLLTCRFNRDGRFLLVCRDTAGSIGFVKLREDGTPGCYELVFAIGESSLWGNGYGTQAVRAAENHIFLERRARLLTARIYHGNQRSVNTVLRCGFRLVQEYERLSCYCITMEEYLDFVTRSTLS